MPTTRCKLCTQIDGHNTHGWPRAWAPAVREGIGGAERPLVYVLIRLGLASCPSREE